MSGASLLVLDACGNNVLLFAGVLAPPLVATAVSGVKGDGKWCRYTRTVITVPINMEQKVNFIHYHHRYRYTNLRERLLQHLLKENIIGNLTTIDKLLTLPVVSVVLHS